LRELLDHARGELRDARNREGIGTVEGRRSALEGQIDKVESQIQQVHAAYVGSLAKVEALKSAIDPLPEPLLKQMVGGMPNDGLASMRDRLFQLQVQREEVRSKYKKGHPMVSVLNEQVREVQEVLDREDPKRPQIASALSVVDSAAGAGLRAQQECLVEQLARLQEKLADLNEKEVHVAEANLRVRQLEEKYTTYVERLEEARIESALRADKISNVSVLQPAVLSGLPAYPKKASSLFFAVLGGIGAALFVGLGSAFWDRWRDSGFSLTSAGPMAEAVIRSDGVDPVFSPRMGRNREVST
jgi:uncharacterized protein involved in exopolysaccharide biosynthesis